ncbi:MAG: cytosolic protein, partial [Blastocatellia bacterium]
MKAKQPKAKTNTEQQDYDSPWKEMLERFFEPCIAFFFPKAHAQIDWSRGVEFLEKELQKIMADAAIGRRLADKLAKVYLLNGEELWVLVHLEVQGQQQKKFEQRMYVYN